MQRYDFLFNQTNFERVFSVFVLSFGHLFLFFELHASAIGHPAHELLALLALLTVRTAHLIAIAAAAAIIMYIIISCVMVFCGVKKREKRRCACFPPVSLFCLC